MGQGPDIDGMGSRSKARGSPGDGRPASCSPRASFLGISNTRIAFWTGPVPRIRWYSCAFF